MKGKKQQKHRIHQLIALKHSKKRKSKIKNRKRKNNRKKIKNLNNIILRSSIKKNLNDNIKNHNRKTLNPPNNFSIINNYDETISFFNEVDIIIKTGMPIAFDMQHINNITFDALLYLLAKLDNFRKQKISYSIIGNLPKHNLPRSFIISSGFLNFFRSNFKSVEYSEDYLQIKSGELNDGPTAALIIDFITKHLPNPKNNTSSLYGILLEMMSNTREHAYLNSSNNKVTKWYLAAKFNRIDQKIEFVFLDTGAGIVRTIKKKWHESFFEVINKLISYKHTPDTDFILSALRGNFRTQTNLKYRGRGLPKINSLSEEKIIDNLTIVTNSGFINKTQHQKIILSKPFEGTLYSWNFV